MNKALRVIVLIFLVVLGTSCSSGAETTAEAEAPAATDTSSPPTDTPAPEVISAAEAAISVDSFEFSIRRIAYDSVVGGMVPNTLGSGRILFIEFDLAAGEDEAFAELMPEILLASGESTQAVAWISSNSVHTLVDMQFTGASGFYSPGEGAFVFAYVVPQDPGALTLVFPSGAMIDLSPLQS